MRTRTVAILLPYLATAGAILYWARTPIFEIFASLILGGLLGHQFLYPALLRLGSTPMLFPQDLAFVLRLYATTVLSAALLTACLL